MLPSLVLIICILFVVFLFRVDRLQSESVSKATWIPLLWMCIAGSRFVSGWLHPGGTAATSTSMFNEGSSIDRAIFFALIIAGIFVVRKRKVSWKELFKSNPWVWLYFLFGLISMVWSDLPLVTLKRWIKGLGNVIMVLVILTETKPYRAMENVLRKLALLLVPFSVVLIRFFPNLGRAYHMGLPMSTGVATQKNTLGMVCLVSGIYFCWMFLFRKEKHKEPIERIRFLLNLSLAAMIAWLFYKADSATSLFCMLMALLIFAVSRIPSLKLNLRRTLIFITVLFAIIVVAGSVFNLKDKVFSSLGRDPNLTDRVPIWNNLLSMVRNPILGFGYESFWLGDRVEIIEKTWHVRGNAHNGYIQMYLDLGLVGIFFIIAWIISGLKKTLQQGHIEYPIGLLRLILIFTVALYNYTEATFYGVSLMWIILLLGIMNPPEMHSDQSEKSGPFS